MRLGINGWRVHGQRTGVGRYVANLVEHWDAATVGPRFDDVVFYSQKAVSAAGIALPPNIRARVIGPDWPLLVWENVRLGPASHDDVLFCPSYSRPIRTRARTVVTIFEATLKLYPEYFPREHWYSLGRAYLRLYEWSGKHSARVLTTTEAGRRDIVRGYGIPAEKIHVVPLAPIDAFRPVDDDARVRAVTRKYLGDDAPFFLFVGKMTPRRNVPMLMEAFAAFTQRQSRPHRLLVIGKNTTGFDIERHARALGLGAAFKHVSYIPDEDLAGLYSGALAFVLPYSYESTSLTTLEAQATGLPVITIDTPGLREVTGDAAVFLDEATVPAIARALDRVAGSRDLRAELSARGLTFARQFTWRRTAEETLDVLAGAAR